MKTQALVLLSLFTLALPSYADLATQVQSVLSGPRGPFGPTQLQYENSRIDGEAVPTDNSFFRSAYRSPEAQNLARTQNIYFGNLFTTNYYELAGEVVYGGANSNHPVYYPSLLEKAKEANPRATMMVRNWVLEKSYLRALPDSNLASAFRLRMICDFESEAAYAAYFFNTYLKGMTDEFQFLPILLLMRESPITDTSSLSEARSLVANEYNDLNLNWGPANPAVARYYAIRNTIHNQLSKEVVSEINRFLTDFPQYTQEGRGDLIHVRDIVQFYFSDQVSIIQSLANTSAGLVSESVTALSHTPKTSADYPAKLLAFSQAVAALKTNLALKSNVGFQPTTALRLISVSAQFLSKEALELPRADSDTVRILINSAYSEGFLIQDNWTYFQNEIDVAKTPLEIKKILNDIVEVSVGTLDQAMQPTLNQWISFEPAMANFSDNAVKSSSLSALSLFADRIR